jgi:hypothetical protein
MTYDPNTLPEYIAEDLEAPQLFQLGCKLSNKVNEFCVKELLS